MNAFGCKQMKKMNPVNSGLKDWILIFSCNEKSCGRRAVLGWQLLKEVIEDQGPLHLTFPSLVNGFLSSWLQDGYYTSRH